MWLLHLSRVWHLEFRIAVVFGQQEVLLCEVPHGDHCFVLHLRQSRPLPFLLGFPLFFHQEIGQCTTWQCDVETRPRSAMWSWWVFSLLFVVRILCDSMMMFSWSCFEHEEFNLLLSIVDQSVAHGRSQAGAVRGAGLVTLQGIAEALQSLRCSGFPHHQDHRLK